MNNIEGLLASHGDAISTCFYLFDFGFDNNRSNMLFVFKIKDVEFSLGVGVTVMFDIGYIFGLGNEHSIPVNA